MDFDTILGIVIISGGLVFLSIVTFWSRKTINIISSKKLRSIREILKELHHGR